MTSQGGPYSQFKRALGRRNFMVAWTLAAELPKLSLADALSLVLLARDSDELRRFERAVVRWHALLCLEKRLSPGESQLALAALNALLGRGAVSAAQSLVAVCQLHGLEDEVRVLEGWLDSR